MSPTRSASGSSAAVTDPRATHWGEALSLFGRQRPRHPRVPRLGLPANRSHVTGRPSHGLVLSSVPAWQTSIPRSPEARRRAPGTSAKSTRRQRLRSSHAERPRRLLAVPRRQVDGARCSGRPSNAGRGVEPAPGLCHVFVGCSSVHGAPQKTRIEYAIPLPRCQSSTAATASATRWAKSGGTEFPI
jgi:hypothetical protein